MRWNLVIPLRSIALTLIVGLPAQAADVLSGGSNYGPEQAIITNDYCQGECEIVCACEPPTYYSVRTDLLWMGRGKVDPNFLIIAPADAPALSILRTSELEFNVEAGIDVGFSSTRSNGQTWELRYFGIFDQLARERRTYVDGDLVATNDAGIIHFDTLHGSYTDLTTAYSSDLHSGEANVWLSERWGFEAVLGIRWMRQNEDLESFVTTNLSEGASIDFANNLYGGQVGLRRVLWEVPGRFHMETTLKGGAFHNRMKLRGETRTGGATTPTLNRTFSSAAIGGELAVTAVYHLTPYFSARIGYTGLLLDGIGLAAQQIDDFSVATGTGDVDTTTLIYHGGHLGLEFAW